MNVYRSLLRIVGHLNGGMSDSVVWQDGTLYILADMKSKKR